VQHIFFKFCDVVLAKYITKQLQNIFENVLHANVLTAYCHMLSG